MSREITKKDEKYFSIGRNLKKLREHCSITAEQLALNLKINYRNALSYEYDRTNPSLENLIKFSNYFDISIDFLILWEKTNYIHNLRLLRLAEKIDKAGQDQQSQTESMTASLLKGKNKIVLKQDNVAVKLTDSIHTNLKTLRESRNLSQKAISELFGINQSMITHYETKSVPPIQNLLKFSEYFELSVHALVTGQQLNIHFDNMELGNLIFQADHLLSLEEHKMLVHLMEAVLKK